MRNFALNNSDQNGVLIARGKTQTMSAQSNVINQAIQESNEKQFKTHTTKTSIKRTEKSKVLAFNNKKSNKFDDSTFKAKMQPILDAIMQKLVEAEKVTQTQRQLIKQLAGRKYNSNSKEILMTNTNDKDIIKNLNEALQLLSNEDQTQLISIKKVYNEANKKHTKSIMGLRPGEAKKYGAPRPATLAYSKVVELLNYIIYTVNREDKFSSGKYGYALFIINEIKAELDQLKYAINEHDLVVKKDTNTAEVYKLKNNLDFLIDRYHRSSYYK